MITYRCERCCDTGKIGDAYERLCPNCTSMLPMKQTVKKVGIPTCQRCAGLDREGRPVNGTIVGRVSSDEISFLVCESCLDHANSLIILLPKNASGKIRAERFSA